MRTGTTISIEERDGKGFVEILSENADNMQAAIDIVKGIVAIPEVGATYSGKVKTITDFGAFVEFMPGKDGLLHISEISWGKTPSMEGLFEEGQVLEVKLVEVDKKTGKFRLSQRALTPKPEGYVEREREPRPSNGGRNGDRRDDRRGGNGGNRRRD